VKKIVFIILLIIAAIAGFQLIQNKKAQLQAMPTAVKKEVVKVFYPLQKTVQKSQNFTATVVSNDTVTIYAKPVERIVFLADEGQKLTKGQQLFTLDSSEIEAKIAQLQTALLALKVQNDAFAYSAYAAKRSFERAQTLLEADALSRQEYEKEKKNYLNIQAQTDAHQLTIQSKEKELQALSQTHKHYKMKAPFDATVENLQASLTQLNNPAKPLMQLIGRDRRLHFTFSADANITQNDTVLFQNKTYEIAHIFKQNEGYLQKASVIVDDSSLKIGSLHQITVLGAKTEATLVAKDALVKEDGGYFVYLFTNGSFVKQSVDLLFFDQDFAAIKQKLTQPVATGSINKLSLLPAKSNVTIVGAQ
jgi:multidrug efflux pump subunit AcrA (membrane-fusion protein)